MPPLHDPHHSEVRERAFELWAHIYSQNAAAVAEHLRQGKEEDLCPVEIADSTVRAWSSRDGWSARFEGDMKRLAPGIFSSVAAHIMQGPEVRQKLGKTLAIPCLILPRGDVGSPLVVRCSPLLRLVSDHRSAEVRSHAPTWAVHTAAKPDGTRSAFWLR